MSSPAQRAALEELEWRKCFRPDLGPIVWSDHPIEKAKAMADAFIYFCLTYCMIFTKEGGDPIPFTLWDIGTGSQMRAARAFLHHRLIIILKTRQLGLSWLLCAYTLWRVMRDGNIHAFFQSIGLQEVSEQVQRMVFIYENLPDWMTVRNQLGGRGRKDNDTLKQFRNGSTIHAKATTKRAGHGAAPALYGLDEFARNEQDVMTWRAVKPALGNIGQAIIISTANGLGNKYAEMWAEAYSGQSSFEPLFFPASDHPDYTPEFLERERLDYAGDPIGFMEAYPLTPEDAFQSSSRCPFDSTRIKEWQTHIRENGIEPETGRLEDVNGRVKFTKDATGPLMVWAHPVRAKGRKKAHSYTVGADVAEGLVTGDWSVAAVLCTETNSLDAMFRSKIDPALYGYQLELLARYYNQAWLAVEVNRNAEIIMSDLKDTYHWLYCRERRDRIFDLPTLEPGWYTSSKTKPKMISDLRSAFHANDEPLRVYSLTLLSEMSTFEENDKKGFGASGTNHDDTIMALGIALQARKTQPAAIDTTPVHRYDWRSL